MNIPDACAGATNGSGFFMDAAGLATDLATPAIALLVAVIEIRNYSVSRRQARHELFERRFAIYQHFKKFLLDIMANRYPKSEDIAGLYDIIEESRFLFEKNIVEYLEEIRLRADELLDLRRRRESLAYEAHRDALINAESREFDWLNEQQRILHKKFYDHMNLSVK
ncbi:MAG: hypothetical protein HC871_12270 [Rhizobiales bacterium]|nr:hypothetical protein [Hyphomicrobiales bacterium]